MKKISYFIFMIFISVLSGCNKDFIDNKLSAYDRIDEPTTKMAGDGKWDVLGFSYDVTGMYLNNTNASRIVIDPAKLKADHEFRVYEDRSSLGEDQFYAGSTMQDYLKEIKSKNKIDTKGNIGISELSLSGNLDIGFDYATNYQHTTRFSFSRIDMIRINKRLYFDADIELLKKYIVPAFFENLNRLSADQFVKDYGTHVLCDVSVGGRLSFNYRSEIISTSNTSDKKVIVDAGAKFSYGIFGADSKNHHELQTVITKKAENASWDLKIKYYGGSNSGLSYSFDSKSGYPTTTFKRDEWEKSIGDNNNAIVKINWDKAYPIYEFISDPIKKEEIKAAVKRYIESKKVAQIETSPLFRLWNPKEKNSFYTSSLDEANIYLRNGYRLDNGSNEHYVIGYVFKNSQPGTVPLYRLWNSKEKNSFYTTSLSEANTYRGFGYNWDYGGFGNYIIGYVLKDQQQLETKPLFRLWNSKEKNCFYSSSLIETSAYRAIGYNWDYGAFGNYIIGYLLPFSNYK